MDNIICVVGPTASGKTDLAVQLALALGGEVVSCDSMQIYRRMDIGTAKPTVEEMCGIRHHMIDIVEPNDDFSVGKYVQMANAAICDILSRSKPAIVVGGTGLYVDSLISGRTFAPMPSTGKREELEQRAEQDGIEPLLAELRTVDPASADRLHPSDQKRIIRALEVYLETGKTITEHNLQTQQIPPRYKPVWLGLTFSDRADLYERIDRRVDLMLEQGLVQEVQSLLDAGIAPNSTAMQAIGYKEMAMHLHGELTLEQAADLIRQRSRNYAKRQLTWFRKNADIHWLLRTPEQTSSALFALARQHIPFFAQD
ncbi:MAG: tRNA (adenosine(37)-N6)-dimethylallyltransferase MiaA [Oscillospiraceae bacterium]|nr:tRNA (adenosine(37)-N6)-dimethylallyltransferase MiaA [Oscillospiraceae bacterium]